MLLYPKSVPAFFFRTLVNIGDHFLEGITIFTNITKVYNQNIKNTKK